MFFLLWMLVDFGVQMGAQTRSKIKTKQTKRAKKRRLQAKRTTAETRAKEEETNPLGKALVSCILVAAFVVFVVSKHSFRVADRLVDNFQPQAAGDGKIPGGWGASPPPRNVHVSRAPGASG